LTRAALDVQRANAGFENPNTLMYSSILAETLIKEARYDEAEQLLRSIVPAQERLLGPDYMEAAQSKYDLACVLAHRKQPAEALALLRAAVDHGLNPQAALDMEKDDDLKPLRSDPRFQKLVSD